MGKRKQFDDILEGRINPRPATVRKLLDNERVMATPRLGGKRYGAYVSKLQPKLAFIQEKTLTIYVSYLIHTFIGRKVS